MMNFNEMKKDELVALVEKMSVEIENLKRRGKRGGSLRRLEVLEWLGMNGSGKILDIANGLGIESKNVSSQLTYLKKDGWGIITNEEGKKEVTKYKGEVVDAGFVLDFVKGERERDIEKGERERDIEKGERERDIEKGERERDIEKVNKEEERERDIEKVNKEEE
jgi:hypothetical protein